MLEELNENFASELYDRDSRSMTNICRIVFDYQNPIGINSLMQQTELTRQTIYKYIREINKIYSNIKHSGPIISNINGQYFFNGSHLDYAELFLEIISNTVLTKFAIALINKPSIDFKEFCYENFISQSTVRRLIGNINIHLEKFAISITVKNNSISIEGNEAKIRYIFATYFWRTFRGLYWPFDMIDKISVINFIDALEKKFHFKIKSGQKMELIYIITVNICRAKNEHSIDSVVSFNNYFMVNFLSELEDNFEQISKNFFSVPKTDLKFILIWFATLPQFYSINGSATLFLESLKNNNVQTESAKFIEIITKSSPASLKLTAEQYNELLLALICGRLSIEMFGNLTFTISDLNLNKYTNILAPSYLKRITMLLIKTHPSIDKSLLHALAIRYGWALSLFMPIHRFERTINIYLDTDILINLENQMKNQLRSILCNFFNIKIDTDINRLNRADLILTTSFLFDSLPANTPKIQIHPQLSSKEMNVIIEFCEDFIKL